MSFSGRGSAYENRRAGDRIIQDANQPIRNNQYNAFAYSTEDNPPPGPPQLTPMPAPEPDPPPVAERAAEAVPAAAPKAEIVPLPQPNPMRHRPVQRLPIGKRLSQR